MIFTLVKGLVIASALMRATATLAQPQPPADQPKAETIAPSLELPSSVLNQIKDLVLPTAPVSQLKTLRLEIIADSAAGRPATQHIERLENGLWGIALVAPIAKGANVMRALSLQGVIPLGMTLDLYNEVTVPVVPPGKGFIPLITFKNSVRTSTVRKSTSLSGDLAALVNPQPGSKFSYATAFETQTTARGMFSTSAGSKHELVASCVLSEARAASNIHPNLKGMSVDVTCEAHRNGQSDGVQNYVYLIESQLYVLTRAVGAKGNTTQYKITDVEYLVHSNVR